ncbi:unnamed protein product [Caenorhabditis auriculariae]|uniref:Uncharacterized protein n=1 Tax=Caenorhabditis auriculariae TaxID=2777116 RepID=A0A8S1HMU7_9PELO|nr:unnamed protein product [Caenorhabditis auriculariae]
MNRGNPQGAEDLPKKAKEATTTTTTTYLLSSATRRGVILEEDGVDGDDAAQINAYAISNGQGEPIASRLLDCLTKRRRAMFRRNQSSSNLGGELPYRPLRRPSLPSIPQAAVSLPMSSVGHQRDRRRPSLVDWAENRIHAVDIDSPIGYFVAHFKDIDETLEKVPFESRMRLFEAFEGPLRARGCTVNEVEFFLENSSTAIPENSEARYLAGSKIIVRVGFWGFVIL